MINWGIIGPGKIAKAFAFGLNSVENCCAYGVAGRNAQRAKKFAQENNIERSFDTIDELLASPDIDAIYVAVPHSLHKEFVCKALNHDKHVLCEKPMALSFEDVATIIRTARANKRIVLEGFMYRYHPQTAELLRLLRAGTIGRLCSMDISFGCMTNYDSSSRLWQIELGGGAMWDIGVYPVSMSNLIAAAVNNNRLLEPDRFIGTGEFLRDGVDLRAAGIIHYPNGILSKISCAISVNEGAHLKIHGETGNIIVNDPWVASRDKATNGEIIIERRGCENQVIKVNAFLTSFAYEAAYFSELLEGLRYAVDFPIMTNEESLFQVACMEQWRKEALICPSVNEI